MIYIALMGWRSSVSPLRSKVCSPLFHLFRISFCQRPASIHSRQTVECIRNAFIFPALIAHHTEMFIWVAASNMFALLSLKPPNDGEPNEGDVLHKAIFVVGAENWYINFLWTKPTKRKKKIPAIKGLLRKMIKELSSKTILMLKQKQKKKLRMLLLGHNHVFHPDSRRGKVNRKMFLKFWKMSTSKVWY